MRKDIRGHTRVPNWLLRKGSPVSGSALLVLVYLWSRTNRDLECWPSIEKIAGDLDLGESTVKRAIVKLRAIDLVGTKKDRDSRGQYERTIYRLADLEQGPGVKVTSGPGVKTTSGPQVTPRGHVQGSKWTPNNPQLNKTHSEQPPFPPAARGAEVALSTPGGGELDLERDVPAWLVFKAYAKKVGIEPGQIAEKIFEGIPAAYLLGYLVEFLRKKPKIRTTSAAWLVDKCKRQKPPPGCDHDKAKMELRPYLERAVLPGVVFADLLPEVEKEKSLAEKKNETIAALKAAARDNERATG